MAKSGLPKIIIIAECAITVIISKNCQPVGVYIFYFASSKASYPKIIS
jgi:hypothetical protein